MSTFIYFRVSAHLSRKTAMHLHGKCPLFFPILGRRWTKRQRGLDVTVSLAFVNLAELNLHPRPCPRYSLFLTPNQPTQKLFMAVKSWIMLVRPYKWLIFGRVFDDLHISYQLRKHYSIGWPNNFGAAVLKCLNQGSHASWKVLVFT